MHLTRNNAVVSHEAERHGPQSSQGSLQPNRTEEDLSPRETPPIPPCLLSSPPVLSPVGSSTRVQEPETCGRTNIGSAHPSSAPRRKRWSHLPCGSCRPPLLPHCMIRRADMKIQPYTLGNPFNTMQNFSA